MSDVVCKNDNTTNMRVAPEFLEHLKCPGCLESMSDLIKICAMGHSVCDPCSKVLQNCPKCGMLYQGGRNYTLEHLLNYLEIPCVHQKRGCQKNLKLSLYKDHGQTCAYRNRRCFAYMLFCVDECDWEGPLSEMPEHFRDCHPQLVSDENSLQTWDFINYKQGVTLEADEYFLIHACVTNDEKETICFAMIPAHLAQLQETHDLVCRKSHKTGGSAHTWELVFDNFQIQHGCFQDASFLESGTAIDMESYDICLTETNFKTEFSTGTIQYRVKIQKPNPRNMIQFFVPMS